MNSLASIHLRSPTTTGVATYPQGASFGPRAMRDYEFVWIIEGDSEYRWADKVVAAPPGSIVLCRPGAYDYFKWDAERRTRHAFFHFMIEKLPPNWPDQSEWPLVQNPPDGDILRPLFRQVLALKPGDDPILGDLATAQMLASFILGHLSHADVSRDALPDAVECALKFLHDSLEEDPAAAITLENLADSASITPEHLCRVFKVAIGLTPAETVRLAKLDRAAVLLARSNFPVGRIAEMCGFASQFHFSRRFREAFGKSPRDLRKDMLAGKLPPLPRLMRNR